MGSPFDSWLGEFLKKRDLERPDRRPLYRYRLSEGEFESLSELLRTKIGEYRRNHFKLAIGGDRSLTFIFENFPGFPALFVLYAAEWWRQFYDGKYSWGPILESLETQENEWHTSSRGKGIQQGFAYWGIPVERGHSRSLYLSTIARQAGLPMRLLASARGQIGSLFQRVLLELAGEDESLWTGESLRVRVERHSHYLPRVYRDESIFQLLADVIGSLLSLREEAALTGSEDDLARLNERIPHWKDQFPFPPSDRHFSELLEALVLKASKSRAGSSRGGIFFKRCLEGEPGSLATVGHLSLPRTIGFRSLQELFRFPDSILPPRLLSLTLLSGDEEQLLSLRRSSEVSPTGDLYIPPHASLLTSDSREEVRLRLTFPDGQAFEISPPGGEALDPLLPWIFTEKNEEWVLLRQGGGRVPASSFHLSVPPDARVEEISRDGTLTDSSGRRIVFSTSPVRVRIGEESFLLTPDEGGADEGEYRLKGTRVNLGTRSPVYRGLPRVEVRTVGGTVRPIPPEKVEWKVPGGGWSPRLPEGYAGPCEIRVRDGGETVFSARPFCVPSEAAISILPESERSGRLVLHSFGLQSLSLAPSSFLVETSVHGDECSIRVTDRGGGVGAGEIVGEILWKGGLRRTPFRLPLPFRGVRAIGPQGESLAPGSLRDLRDLMGVRLVFFPGPSARNISLILQLDAKERRGTAERRIPLALSSPHQPMEVRLVDIRSEMMELLAQSDELSAMVGVVGEIDEKRTALFHVARYAVSARAVREEKSVIFSPGAPSPRPGPDHPEEITPGSEDSFLEQMESLAGQVLALRMEVPDEDPLQLAPDSPPTRYHVPIEGSLPPGTWLVYPGKEARITFRPVAFNLQQPKEEREGATALDEAFADSDEEMRKHDFGDLFDRLVQDFADPDWDRIVELAGRLGHLPLPALDLWRATMVHPPMMAAMLLRYPSIPWEGFLERYSQESLFLWESVEISQWVNVYRRTREHLESLLPPAAVGIIFDNHFRSRMRDLSFLHPSLNFLADVLPRLSSGSESGPELPDTLNTYPYQTLFKGADCAYQRLRRTDKMRWPQDLSEWIGGVGKTPLGQKFWRDGEDFRTEVINFPAMLAVSAYVRGPREKLRPKHFVGARNLMNFDRDWFSDAYHLTMSSIFFLFSK